MNAISISSAFSSLMTRYRQQLTDLDSAEDEQDIDRLADASQETLSNLCSTRARSTTDLADKIDALVGRFSDYGCVPMEHIRELLADAQQLATEPGLVTAWARLWHDLGCSLQIMPDGERMYWQPDPHVVSNRCVGELPPHLILRSEAEANGAAKTLLSLVRLAGKRASDAVFAFADTVREN